ncbi:hypothetical protein GCM10027280_63100 [Micromonospora polyrhachis]|uniref:Uncharacterized protein n=1 Tax=Micromonospora polyrhachis TaxID=1282883 RepID=A0A7W7SS92_9ACTN|nr:hypothetical protein [Micromonospora polyrhachis]MBB4959382.1 hypothetical protein [Micromonospora polyrhachis]
MTPSLLVYDILAGSAETEEPSFLDNVLGVLALLAIAAFFVRGYYRERIAISDAETRAKSLSHSERDAIERQVLDVIYKGRDHALSIREIASEISEHERYVIRIVRPLVKWGQLEVTSAHDESLPTDFNSFSKVAVTAEGDKRLRERDPVVTYNEYFSVGDNSNVVNKSVIVNSNVGTYRSRYGTDTVEALRELEHIVRGSNNDEAVEVLDGFLAEARTEEPSRARMKALFSSLQQMVPAVSGAADLASRIAAMFS